MRAVLAALISGILFAFFCVASAFADWTASNQGGLVFASDDTPDAAYSMYCDPRDNRVGFVLVSHHRLPDSLTEGTATIIVDGIPIRHYSVAITDRLDWSEPVKDFPFDAFSAGSIEVRFEIALKGTVVASSNYSMVTDGASFTRALQSVTVDCRAAYLASVTGSQADQVLPDMNSSSVETPSIDGPKSPTEEYDLGEGKFVYQVTQAVLQDAPDETWVAGKEPTSGAMVAAVRSTAGTLSFVCTRVDRQVYLHTFYWFDAKQADPETIRASEGFDVGEATLTIMATVKADIFTANDLILLTSTGNAGLKILDRLQRAAGPTPVNYRLSSDSDPQLVHELGNLSVKGSTKALKVLRGACRF